METQLSKKENPKAIFPLTKNRISDNQLTPPPPKIRSQGDQGRKNANAIRGTIVAVARVNIFITALSLLQKGNRLKREMERENSKKKKKKKKDRKKGERTQSTRIQDKSSIHTGAISTRGTRGEFRYDDLGRKRETENDGKKRWRTRKVPGFLPPLSSR